MLYHSTKRRCSNVFYPQPTSAHLIRLMGHTLDALILRSCSSHRAVKRSISFCSALPSVIHVSLKEIHPTHCSDVTLGVITALLRTTSLSDETSSDSSSLGLSLDGPAWPVMLENG